MASGWQIAADRLPVAVLSTDAHGHVRSFNRLVAATFSTAPETIKGVSIGRFIPGADVLIAAGVRGSGDVVRLVGLREDTGEFPLELTITRDDGGFIAIVWLPACNSTGAAAINRKRRAHHGDAERRQQKRHHCRQALSTEYDVGVHR